MFYSKKMFLIVGLFLSTTFFCSSQPSASKGDLLINPSVTIGWYNYSYGLNRVSVVPPVGLNFEYQFADYFGAGLEGTYSSRKYQDFNFSELSSSYSYEYKSVSLRGSFHYWDLLKMLFEEELLNEKLDALDLYVMASTGLQWTNSTRTWRDGSNSEAHEEKFFDSYWRTNYAAGARYYFSDNFGAFIEGGRNSFGWAKLGITFKF